MTHREAQFSRSFSRVASAIRWKEFVFGGTLGALGSVIRKSASAKKAETAAAPAAGPEEVPDGVEELGVGPRGQDGNQEENGEREPHRG